MSEQLENKDTVKEEISQFLKIRDAKGCTLLHHVAKSGDQEFAKKLIEWGCDVNASNNKRATPLVVAIRKNQLEIIKILWDAGACCKNYYFEPVHLAVHSGYPDAVQLLLDLGADANERDDRRTTPLHWAIRWSDDDRPSDVSLKIIKILIDSGADINAVNEDYCTPLLEAAFYNFQPGIELLKNMGAVLRREENADFHYIHSFLEERDFEIFHNLVKLGGDVHEVDEFGNNSLHAAASRGLHDIVEFLLIKGLRIDSVNNEGLDPLCCQLNNWCNEIRPYASVNDDHDKDFEDDPDFISAMKCVDILIKHGANVNHVTNVGMTPLYIVLDNRMHSTLVRILLKNRAQLDFDHPSVLKMINDSNGSKIPHLLLRHTAMFREVLDRTNAPVHFDVEKLNDKSRQDFARCRAELELMRATKIGDTNVSFLKLLVNRDIGPYARNESVINAFDPKIVSIEFSIYSDLVIERFSREVEFQKLVKTATDGLARVLNWDRNSKIVPLAKIVSYLNEKDMTTLSLI